MYDDPKSEEAKSEQPAPAPEEEKKVVAKKRKASGAKKKVASGGNSKTKAKKAKTAKAKGGRSRLDPEAKVTKTGKENPYRKGSEVWERVETVLKSSGQTVKTIQGKAGVKPTTLATMKRMGLIKIEA